MNRIPRLPRLVPFLLLAGVLLATSGCAAWRLSQSFEMARRSEPFRQAPDNAALRLLIVGDSTAVGTGASSARTSLAGLIAAEHPDWLIDNRARDGAKFADVLAQLDGGQDRYDVVLVQAGGNDVIRLSDLDELRSSIDAVAERARQRGAHVILMPAGNVGNAPFFFAPLSWWMTQRSREMHGYVEAAATRTDAVYVDLFHERADDPFVQNPGLNARDGLHPSDAGYQVWYRELLPALDSLHLRQKLQQGLR